jgi:hypothetical protein
VRQTLALTVFAPHRAISYYKIGVVDTSACHLETATAKADLTQTQPNQHPEMAL